MMRRNMRLKPQPPVQKVASLGRGPTRNTYRRSRRRGGGRRWRGPVLLTLGVMVVAGLSLGLMVLYYQLLTSPLFCIKENKNIEIVGLKRLTADLILKQAKLGPETNLLALKPAQVEQDLLTHPWIARAEVTRRWPHRLHLNLTEREPVAIVQMGELHYVDRQGSLFKPLSPGDPHDFPVITGLTREHFLPSAETLPEIVTQALQLLEILKAAAPPLNLENVSEVHVDLERGFSLYANGLSGALDLGLGEFPEKLQKFAQIWPILTQKGYLTRIGRINLDPPQRVLISLKGEEN